MLKVGMAQINPTVGDIEGNKKKILENISDAALQGVDLLVFPEMCVTGYPPEDLLYYDDFLKKNREALEDIASSVGEMTVIVGFVDFSSEVKKEKRVIWNSAAVIRSGSILKTIHKTLLPTYDVFDEDRYFSTSDEVSIVDVGFPLGVEICEDLWDDSYERKITRELAEKGAKLIVNISASPFYIGKRMVREKLVLSQALANSVPLVYLNTVGGQDELVFDGRSLAAGADGNIIARGPEFSEALVVFDLDLEKGTAPKVPAPPYCREEEIFRALTLNLRDYFYKTGVFDKIVVGLSGGVDSAFTAAVAAEAVGPENVVGVSMPSRFSSGHSQSDAARLAENLEIGFMTVPIELMHRSAMETFSDFAEISAGVAEENIQARIRGNILMYLSNKFGWLLVSTGNKSEIATGYCTLYGDTAGGKNVPGDLYKTQLYDVCRWLNRDEELIPENILIKPPSAELRPDQKDSDSLPDYALLDDILLRLIEKHMSRDEIVAEGFPEADVNRVADLVFRSEFKRRQLVHSIKVTPRAFGIGRRMPIVNKYDY